MNEANLLLCATDPSPGPSPSCGEGRELRLPALVLLSVLLLLLAACADQPDPGSLIRKVSILSITAEPPEATPGETIVLEACVVDADGVRIRPVASLWGFAVGTIDPSAPGALQGVALNRERYELTVPETIDPDKDGRDGIAPLYVFTAISQQPFDPGMLADPEAFLTGPDNRLAFRTVAVSRRDTKNRNPETTGIAVSFDGGPIAPFVEDGREVFTLPAEARHREIVIECSATDDTDPPEELDYQWFASSGYYASRRTPEIEWDAPPDPVEANGYVVVRDREGGQAWRGFALRLE